MENPVSALVGGSGRAAMRPRRGRFRAPLRRAPARMWTNCAWVLFLSLCAASPPLLLLLIVPLPAKLLPVAAVAVAPRLAARRSLQVPIATVPPR